MNGRVLFVDDNPDVLSAYERKLRGRIELETAQGGAEALLKLQSKGPFMVIVADMRMPEMDGITLLKEVQRRYPSIVRIMLTGNMDQSTAVLATNEGHVFRYLTKPCDTPVMVQALEDAAEHFRTIQIERELLNTTVMGIVSLLFEILSQVDHEGWQRALSIKRLATQIAEGVPGVELWEVELAALLCRLGEAVLPPNMKQQAGQNEQKQLLRESLLAQIPERSSRLLAHIPRFEKLVRDVRYHEKNFDGTGIPIDAVRGDSIPAVSRLLKVAIDLTRQLESHDDLKGAVAALNANAERYDPQILQIAHRLFVEQPAMAGAAQESTTDAGGSDSHGHMYLDLGVSELRPGMYVAEVVRARNGVALVGAGSEITEVMLERIRNYHEFTGVQEPIRISLHSSNIETDSQLTAA